MSFDKLNLFASGFFRKQIGFFNIKDRVFKSLSQFAHPGERGETTMIIQRILTNNALITLDDEGKEQIVCGKGIGYKKNIGDEIDQSLINKVYILMRNALTKQLEKLLCDIPLEYIETADKIIEMAHISLGKRMNDSLLISLSDHLHSSMMRFLDGVNISNGLIWDIKQFYEEEFEIGCKALDIIEDSFKVRLPEAEAAYIALHLVNAETDDSSMEEVYQITKVIQDITNIVKYYFSINFDTKSAYYYRFITHLKYFARRMFAKKQYQEDDFDLLKVVKVKYETAYKCVCKIGAFLEHKYQYVLLDEEKLYLTIHIQRMVYKCEK